MTRRLVLACVGALLPALAAAQYPPVVTRSRLDPSRGVNFSAILLPDTVYVGQQATYQIGVFLNQEVRQRLRRNPEFVPPETRSLLVYDLPDAKSPLVGTIDGHAYEVHVFQRAFFALSPGRYVVPPARLTYALPQTASFFSREDTHTLRSETLTLTVLPVPAAGRPADWGGAVGRWRARLRIDSVMGRVGDPLVVTLQLEGQGNIALLPRPTLVVPWGTVVAADERVIADSTPSTMRGVKEFDWLLTPKLEGRLTIPPQRFAYFDPVARKFDVAITDGLDVTVAAGNILTTDAPTTAAPPPTVPKLEFGIRETIGRASSVGWLRAPWFVILMLLAPLPALAGAIARRPRRARGARTNAERLSDDGADALATAPGAPTDASALRRLLHDALRDRLGVDVGLALAGDVLVVTLRHEGITRDTAERAATLLRALDAAAFAGHPDATPPSRRELSELYRAIDGEARRHGAGRGVTAGGVTVGLVLLAFVALPGDGWARQADAAGRAFQRAREAYASGDFVGAQRNFRDVAREHPRHANVWADLGTAAWQAADTATAVQGWQRALRLAPLDLEVRNHLALVRAVQDRGPALVPFVPSSFGVLGLLIAWVTGWTLLARRVRRGRPIVARAALLTAGCAVLLAGVAWLDDIDRGARFAVVTRPEPLRTLPVLGADRGAAPLTGEVARILQRRGAWTEVQLFGQRTGWIATELLLPLGGD